MPFTVSLFAGRIRPLPETGRPSGIFKEPAHFPVRIETNGIVGDEQADRRVHGGPDKAVHLYPATHYASLARRFPEIATRFTPGSIGENISSAGLTEVDVRVGDIWQLGSARLQVCQPRSPCWKIDARYGREGIAKFIAGESITGWYWRVVEPGIVHAGDLLELVDAAHAPSLREALDLLGEHRPPLDRLRQLIDAPGIADNWRTALVKRVDWLQRNG